MIEGPKTQSSSALLWTGRAAWIATLLLLAAFAASAAVRIMRGEWHWFPKPSDAVGQISSDF
jgi:hypothetical protein